MGTDRTSEPESLNIGTPFQMTLEAVGTPPSDSRCRPENCSAEFPVFAPCHFPHHPRRELEFGCPYSALLPYTGLKWRFPNESEPTLSFRSRVEVFHRLV